MEKLMLRSVMYGADKIPDKWFEKIPGGWFREKEHSKKGDAENRGHHGREKDGRYYDEVDDDKDNGYRSEGHRRRHRRSRSSYDGGADEDYRRSGDGRQRPRRGKSHRRRRSVDDNRYGYDDGHRGSTRDRDHDDRRGNARPPYPTDPYFDHRNRPSTQDSDRRSNPYSPNPYAGGGATAGATGATQYPQSTRAEPPASQSPQFPQAPQQGQRSSMGSGYVPYSDIYGQPNPQPSSRPPPFDRATRPNGVDSSSPTVSSPPQGYQQNPFAQQAPTAAAAGAGAQYTGQPGFINTESYEPDYNPRRYTGYDENQNPDSRSPSPNRRQSRRDYSPINDSNGDRRDERRADSERRNGGKSQDRARERYEDSRRSSQAKMPRPTTTNRDNEDRRQSGSQRDGPYESRQESRRRDDGYYSD